MRRKSIEYLVKNGEMETLKALAAGQIAALADDASPKKFWGSLASLRYMGMLSKPSTINRNLVGNLAFFMQETTATRIGSAARKVRFPWQQKQYNVNIRLR